MSQGPEFRHLEYFVAVAEEGSFSAAANRLHVAQPSLSTQIKKLEEIAGTTLFMRGRGAFLTPAGNTFLPIARHMLEMRDRSMRTIASVHLGKGLPLHLGYTAFINQSIVQDAIRGYLEFSPNGKVEPWIDFSGALTKMVMEGFLDAALVTMPIQKRDGLLIHLVCKEKLMICLRMDDPLAQQPMLSREAMTKNLPVLFSRDRHPLLYEHLLRRFTKAGIPLHPSNVTAPADMQLLVKAKLGFGVIRETVPLDSELTKRDIEGLSLTVKTALISNAALQRPVVSLLGYRLAKLCSDRSSTGDLKCLLGGIGIPGSSLNSTFLVEKHSASHL